MPLDKVGALCFPKTTLWQTQCCAGTICDEQAESQEAETSFRGRICKNRVSWFWRLIIICYLSVAVECFDWSTSRWCNTVRSTRYTYLCQLYHICAFCPLFQLIPLWADDSGPGSSSSRYVFDKEPMADSSVWIGRMMSCTIWCWMGEWDLLLLIPEKCCINAFKQDIFGFSVLLLLILYKAHVHVWPGGAYSNNTSFGKWTKVNLSKGKVKQRKHISVECGW